MIATSYWSPVSMSFLGLESPLPEEQVPKVSSPLTPISQANCHFEHWDVPSVYCRWIQFFRSNHKHGREIKFSVICKPICLKQRKRYLLALPDCLASNSSIKSSMWMLSLGSATFHDSWFVFVVERSILCVGGGCDGHCLSLTMTLYKLKTTNR